jgi:hypothetical protein
MSGFDGSHYEVQGVNPLDDSPCFGMPRVTTILDLLHKPALMQWSANVAAERAIREIMCEFSKGVPCGHIDTNRYAYKQVSEDAVDFGSQLHDALEGYNRFLTDGTGSAPLSGDETLDRWFSDWVMFCKKSSLKPIIIEKTIIGRGYAGTDGLGGRM